MNITVSNSATSNVTHGYVYRVFHSPEIYNGVRVDVATDLASKHDESRLNHCLLTGHDLYPILDEYGNPSGFLMCDRCLGLADDPKVEVPRSCYLKIWFHDRPSRLATRLFGKA